MGIQFYYDSLIKDVAAANLTANSEATNYPVERVQTRWGAECWRSNTANAEWIKADLGSAQNFSGVFLKTHNLTAGATILFQANSADNWVTPALNVAIPHNNNLLSYVWANNESYRYVRVYFDDDSNPDGYIKVGVWWLGARFAPTRDFIKDYSYELVDPAVLNYSDEGQLSTITKTKFYLRHYSFPNSADITSWKSMLEDIGYSKELFLVENSTNYNSTSCYTRIAACSLQHTYANYWDVDLQLEDMR